MFALYDYLMRMTLTPYLWGGNDPIKGFDCSGLAIEFLQAAGILPHGYDSTASGLHAHLKEKGATELTEGRFGALVFFGNPIMHVGICVDPFHMVEAGGGGSKTISLEAAADQNAYVRLRPIGWRKDKVSILLPNYSAPSAKAMLQ